MASSLIRGKHLLSPASSGETTVLYDAAVYQEDGVIKEVGPYQSLRAKRRPDEELGGLDYAIIPGLVNSHHHGRGVTTLQMGTCDDCLEMWILAGWGRRFYDHYLMALYTAVNNDGVGYYHRNVQSSSDRSRHSERGRGCRVARVSGRRHASGILQLLPQSEPGGLWR